MSLPYAIIIEPNESLHKPYSFMKDAYESDRCASIESGLSLLAKRSPDIVFLSSSYSISKMLKILEAIKHKSHLTLIPLVIVVDLSNRINNIPGTSWGNKIGIVTSISSVKEYNSTLNRVTTA